MQTGRLDRRSPFEQGSSQTVTAVHQTTVLIYNNGAFGVGLVDPFAVSGDLSDGRRTTCAKPAVLVQFLKTLYLDFKFR